MSSLSTAQFDLLRHARRCNAEGRGIHPPRGPKARPFRFLVTTELIEARADGHYITDAGRAALTKVEGPKP